MFTFLSLKAICASSGEYRSRTFAGNISAQHFCACNAFRFHHTWAVFVQHIIADILKCIFFLVEAQNHEKHEDIEHNIG